MIDERFASIVKSGQPAVVIIAGSDSDKKHIDKIVPSLERKNLPYDVRVCSAHKEGTELDKMMQEYNELKGRVAYITIAGGTDALSGGVAFHAEGPVFSCPPDAPNQSCLMNPPGSPNLYYPYPESVGSVIRRTLSIAEYKTKPGCGVEAVVLLVNEKTSTFDITIRNSLDSFGIFSKAENDTETNEVLPGYSGNPVLFVSRSPGQGYRVLVESGVPAIYCSPNISVAHPGELPWLPDPRNVGKFAVQLFGMSNATQRELMRVQNQEKILALQLKDQEFQREYAARQRR